jgi:GWxTD domain-containing protein
MKNNIFSHLLLLLLVTCVPKIALALDAGVSYAVFCTPDGKPYVEVNLEIAAGSVMYRHVDSVRMQAGVEVLILIKKGEAVARYEKYALNSPLLTFPESLLDVKRLSVPQGDYTLEVSVQDLNDASNTAHFSKAISVRFDGKIALSELQLLRSFKVDNSDNPFSKNGYYLEPLPFNFYDRQATLLAFYAEIYHSDQSIPEGKYQVRYVIEKDGGNGQKQLISAGSQEKNRSQLDALLVQMDISKLESGNFTLLVELRSKNNELLTSRSLAFQRSNPFLSFSEDALTAELLQKQFVQNLKDDELVYSMRAISPMVIGDEADALLQIMKDGKPEEMRFFLFRYFVEQDPNNPEQAYYNYIALANAAHKKFVSGFRYGFETDRGRTFLRFGQADDVVHVEDEPGAPPYEIWIYYKFPKTGQANVKFLFYNPSLAGDDYIILHSTARGEIKNPKWERELYKRNPQEFTEGDNYQDATNVQRNNGRNARVYFEDF